MHRLETQERPALASGGGSAGRTGGFLTVVEGPREEHLHHPRGPQGCPDRAIRASGDRPDRADPFGL